MAPRDGDGVSPHSERTTQTSTSPADSRTPSRHDFASAPDQGLSESFQSTDTVRRRPEPSYGTVLSPTQPTPPSHTHGEPSDRPHHYRSGTGQSISAARSPLLGPDRGRGRGLRKPPMARRASSNAQAPHRGEIFSVDDALDEIEADEAERQSSYAFPSTLRRRTVAPSLSRVQSSRDGVEDDPRTPTRASVHIDPMDPADIQPPAEEEDHPDPEDEGPEEVDEHLDDEDDDISDAESFTLKDRQQAINETHPFGIRLWKPALYKKDRSVQKTAEVDIHSAPGQRVNTWLLVFNIIWTLCFGWWMALIAFMGAVVCLFFAVAPSGREYGRVLWGLASYLFFPFGKFIRLEQQEGYADEDQGEGRSISEYEQWQSGDLEYGRLFFGPDRNRSIIGRSRRSIDSEPSETASLLGRHQRGQTPDSDAPHMKRRLFGRGQWNIGRVVFFLFFYLLITPSLFLVSGICWFLVFWIPMGKVTMLLFYHLRRHPLALSFESDISTARAPMAPHSSIILCTYRAVGSKYWKYTIDGTNIFLINLMAVVMFVIFDWLVLAKYLPDSFLASQAFLFIAGLFSIIPLAYFIGQAVASISAQSSMGLGAAINAFFSTVVEVFLYCVALSKGKGQLVEGSIVGSIFAGVLFLPGLSMCFGAIKRKTQRFNAKSAGVTSTMLLFAVIAAFGPTLFYQIYGTHELKCTACDNDDGEGIASSIRDCKRCYFSQSPALDDRFYLEAVRPYCYMAAIMLFLSYVIGLLFTLRTHAAVIWNTELDEKKHEEHQPSTAAFTGRSMADSTATDVRESHLYRRILGQSLKQVGLPPRQDEGGRYGATSVASTSASTRDTSAQGPGNGSASTPHVVPPKDDSPRPSVHIPGFTDAQNNNLVQQVTEIAATAATFAARDARLPRRTSHTGHQGGQGTVASSTGAKPTPVRTATFIEPEQADPTQAAVSGAAHGGHDAPNWSRLKSSVILMGATILYAIIAEILVDSVDFVLDDYPIDEKFLGITLFALVPNTTEFLNAISFAMNGNIALSMEIGSAYALQVCLLQIPALVLYSAIYPASGRLEIPDDEGVASYTFSLLFPQWDMVVVILCVFLLSYMYGEGKSNYFKGSILLLSYLVVIAGFFFSGFTDNMQASRFDTMGTDGKFVDFKTVGRGSSGIAF